MSTHEFFFIHNYKVMGTTIYKQLPNSYKKLLYGNRTLKDVIQKNPGLKLKLPPRMNLNEKISIDHLHIDTIIEMGFIKKPINEIKFMMIMREPIERFISICNYHYTEGRPEGTLTEHISNLKNKIGDNYYQCKWIKNKNNINVKLFKIENKEGIKKFFKQFGINLNLNKHYNISKKKYSIKDISPENMLFLKNHFKEDYDLYNSI